jgi:nucleotide-binding universal stress UspA family protein/ABC-type transporter Mla MlaB component
MLKITIDNEPDFVTFKLEGKLAGAWVDELKNCYGMLSTFPYKKSVALDLSGVRSVDAAGRNLLAKMVRDGADLATGRPSSEYSLERPANRITGLQKGIKPKPKKPVPERCPMVKSVEPEPQLFKNILFATDFSPSSAAALPYAETIASHYGSKIYSAHVIPPEAYSLVPSTKRDTALREVRGYVAQRMAALLKRPSFQQIPHEVLLDHGEIWPTLSDMADEHDVDLIVIGTHGRRGIQKMVLGSVAEEIFCLATRPVLTVGPGIPPEPQGEARLQRILCPTDLLLESVRAMVFSFWLTQEYQGHLFLLYVAQKVDEKPLQGKSRLEEFCRAHMEQRGERGSEATPEAEYLVDCGSAAERILKVATERKIDLIVLGRRTRSRTGIQLLTHLPGLTPNQVVSLARAPCRTI